MKIRPALSGLTLEEAMARVAVVSSREELLIYLQQHFDFWNPTADNVTIKPYGRDERVGWDLHLICVDGKAALFSDSDFADAPASDQELPPPKFVYTAPWPLTLTHVGQWPVQVPVEPPVELEAGQSVELWWFISAGELRYHHAGSPKQR
jgi:hypothetical protein